MPLRLSSAVKQDIEHDSRSITNKIITVKTVLSPIVYVRPFLVVGASTTVDPCLPLNFTRTVHFEVSQQQWEDMCHAGNGRNRRGVGREGDRQRR